MTDSCYKPLNSLVSNHLIFEMLICNKWFKLNLRPTTYRHCSYGKNFLTLQKMHKYFMSTNISCSMLLGTDYGMDSLVRNCWYIKCINLCKLYTRHTYIIDHSVGRPCKWSKVYSNASFNSSSKKRTQILLVDILPHWHLAPRQSLEELLQWYQALLGFQQMDLERGISATSWFQMGTKIRCCL